MSELQELCAALEAINADILRMASELHARAQAYQRAAANASAVAASSGGAGLAPTTAALQSAATHCERAAQALQGAAGEARAFVQRTVGDGGSRGAAPAPAAHGLADTVREAAATAGHAAARVGHEAKHLAAAAGIAAEIAIAAVDFTKAVAPAIPTLLPAEQVTSISQMTEQRIEREQQNYAEAKKLQLEQEAEEIPAMPEPVWVETVSNKRDPE